MALVRSVVWEFLHAEDEAKIIIIIIIIMVYKVETWFLWCFMRRYQELTSVDSQDNAIEDTKIFLFPYVAFLMLHLLMLHSIFAYLLFQGGRRGKGH